MADSVETPPQPPNQRQYMLTAFNAAVTLLVGHLFRWRLHAVCPEQIFRPFERRRQSGT